MLNIVGSVGTGKTQKLCEFAKEHNAIVVCESIDRMYTKLQGYGILGVTCMSYSDYADEVIQLSESKHTTTRRYVIDDIGKFLQFMSPETIAFTSTVE